MSISPSTLDAQTIPIEAIIGKQLDDKVLKELQNKFPPINPTPTHSLSEVMYMAGQRSIVEWLEHRLKED